MIGRISPVGAVAAAAGPARPPRTRASGGTMPSHSRLALARAEHVGSLLRPPELLQARADFEAGRWSREQLTAAEDRAILHVLDQQRQAGLEILTDGEF